MIYNRDMIGDTERIRQFIEPSQCHAIRDPVWHHIWIPKAFVALLSAPSFLKLQGIRQLGPSALVYPGATHTRYNHSLGVFHVAKRFLERLIAEPQNHIQFTFAGATAFLCAALVHDLGHFPYTHSLKELPLKDHEELTAELVCGQPLSGLIQSAGIDPLSVALIVDTQRNCTDTELSFYRNVLSGVLDPDKLDYLNRDAYFCGVPYGIQDLDFILSRIFIQEGRIGIDASGVSSIEHVLFSKYLMYKAVYWHKTVRTATAMIKRAIWNALEQGILQAEQLYNLDDAHFVHLAANLASGVPAMGLVALVQEKAFHETICEIPYQKYPQQFARLDDMAERNQVEAKLASYLSRQYQVSLADWQVVIDIPEAVSFEVNMPVRLDGTIVSYLDSGTVFTASVVRDFTASLRMVRLLVPRDLAAQFTRFEQGRLEAMIITEES